MDPTDYWTMCNTFGFWVLEKNARLEKRTLSGEQKILCNWHLHPVWAYTSHSHEKQSRREETLLWLKTLKNHLLLFLEGIRIEFYLVESSVVLVMFFTKCIWWRDVLRHPKLGHYKPYSFCLGVLKNLLKVLSLLVRNPNLKIHAEKEKKKKKSKYLA